MVSLGRDGGIFLVQYSINPQISLDVTGCSVIIAGMHPSLLDEFASLFPIDVSHWVEDTAEQVLVFSGPANRQEALELCRFLAGRDLQPELLPPPVPEGRWEVLAVRPPGTPAGDRRPTGRVRPPDVDLRKSR
jgi:hypothetical protein